MGLFVNIFVLTLLLVPRLSFQLAVTTLLLHRTWPWRNHSRRRRCRDEVCYRTWKRWLPSEVQTSRRSGIVKTKYKEMKSVNLDVVSGKRLAVMEALQSDLAFSKITFDSLLSFVSPSSCTVLFLGDYGNNVFTHT